MAPNLNRKLKKLRLKKAVKAKTSLMAKLSMEGQLNIREMVKLLKRKKRRKKVNYNLKMDRKMVALLNNLYQIRL